VDIATMATAAKATGGQVYYYANFQLTLQEQLYRELYRNLTRESGYDGCMKLRCGQGITVKTEYGNGIKTNDAEINVAYVSSDSCFLFELGYDDSLKEDRGAIFQLAFLYTTSNGERRLRVHTLSVPVTISPNKIFKGADMDIILNVYIRQSLLELAKEPVQDVRKKFIQKLVKLFSIYRKLCAPARDNQLVLPESFVLLPIYSLGFLKSAIIGGKPATTDIRSWYISLFNTLPIRDQSPLFYPLLFEIHSMIDKEFIAQQREDSAFIQLPGLVRLKYTSLLSTGIYLMDCLEGLYLWVGDQVPQHILEQLLTPELINADKNILLAVGRLDTDLSTRLFNILSSPRLQRSLSPEIFLIKKGSTLEQRVFHKYFVEEGFKGPGVKDPKDMTYSDYLVHLNSLVQE